MKFPQAIFSLVLTDTPTIINFVYKELILSAAVLVYHTIVSALSNIRLSSSCILSDSFTSFIPTTILSRIMLCIDSQSCISLPNYRPL